MQGSLLYRSNGAGGVAFNKGKDTVVVVFIEGAVIYAGRAADDSDF